VGVVYFIVDLLLLVFLLFQPSRGTETSTSSSSEVSSQPSRDTNRDVRTTVHSDILDLNGLEGDSCSEEDSLEENKCGQCGKVYKYREENPWPIKQFLFCRIIISEKKKIV
jgi:hypothetical protein